MFLRYFEKCKTCLCKVCIKSITSYQFLCTSGIVKRTILAYEDDLDRVLIFESTQNSIIDFFYSDQINETTKKANLPGYFE